LIAIHSLSDGSRVVVDIDDSKANNVDLWMESTTPAPMRGSTFDSRGWKLSGVCRGTEACIDVPDRQRGWAQLSPSAQCARAGKKLWCRRHILSNDYVHKRLVADGQPDVLHQSRSNPNSLVLGRRAAGTKVPFMTDRITQNQWPNLFRWQVGGIASDEPAHWGSRVTSFTGAPQVAGLAGAAGGEPRWRADAKKSFYMAYSGI